MKIQGWVECKILQIRKESNVGITIVDVYLRVSPDLTSDIVKTKFGALSVHANTKVKIVGTTTCDLGRKWCKLEFEVESESFWQKYKIFFVIAGLTIFGVVITDVLTPKRGWLTKK